MNPKIFTHYNSIKRDTFESLKRNMILYKMIF